MIGRSPHSIVVQAVEFRGSGRASSADVGQLEEEGQPFELPIRTGLDVLKKRHVGTAPAVGPDQTSNVSPVRFQTPPKAPASSAAISSGKAVTK